MGKVYEYSKGSGNSSSSSNGYFMMSYFNAAGGYRQVSKNGIGYGHIKFYINQNVLDDLGIGLDLSNYNSTYSTTEIGNTYFRYKELNFTINTGVDRKISINELVLPYTYTPTDTTDYRLYFRKTSICHYEEYSYHYYYIWLDIEVTNLSQYTQNMYLDDYDKYNVATRFQFYLNKY